MSDILLYQSFLDLISKTAGQDLNAALIELLAANSKLVNIPKKEFILKEGDSCNVVYYILSGKARSFYTDYTGKTTTWLFHFNAPESNIKNLFLVDYKSFLSNLRSSISIETLTDVQAIKITREQNEFLIEHSSVFERWIRKLNEKAFIYTYDRVFTMLMMDATQRYHKLLEEEPHLIQMFSNYHIASYLGVAPQSLSRIRTHG